MSTTFSTFGNAFDSPQRVETRFLTSERLVVAGSGLLTAGLIAIKPGVVHYEFPAIALVVGAYLYRKNPVSYVSFTLWLYFLSPLIRRVVDFRSSWMNPSPILLAPLLVTSLTGWFLLTNLNRSWFRKDIWPFALALLGITLGLLCGLYLNAEKKDVIAAYLNWLAPICFGYFILRFPLDREQLKKTVTRTFVSAAFLMGIYGIYQFVQAPGWDCNWLDLMSNGDIGISVMGRPEPFGLRVWSTMNSPGPFSTALTAALLLVFVDTRKLRIPAALAGFASFLLTLVRSGWLGWVAGLFAVLASSRKYIVRVLLSLVVGAVLLLPALYYEPVADTLQSRLQSFQSIGNDESANERATEYVKLTEEIFKNPFGTGLTNKDKLDGYVLDSTLLRLPLQLGWVGCLFYCAAIGLLVRRMFPLPAELQFSVVARAIAISVLVRAPFGQVLVSVDGLILWMFVGFAVTEAEEFKQFATGLGQHHLNEEFG
jgi:hypothetical protein